MKKVNPYSPNQAGSAMEACYNSCQTCKFSSDRRMQLHCMHPKRDKAKVYVVSAQSEGSERTRSLQASSNYSVSTDEWCDKYSAMDIDNSPEDYSTGGTATGTGAG